MTHPTFDDESLLGDDLAAIVSALKFLCRSDPENEREHIEWAMSTWSAANRPPPWPAPYTPPRPDPATLTAIILAASSQGVLDWQTEAMARCDAEFEADYEAWLIAEEVGHSYQQTAWEKLSKDFLE